IDPVDMNRNLAASISKRAYKHANYQIKQFLDNPSIEYFLKKPLSPPPPQLLSQLLPNLVSVEFISDQSIHYSELRDKITSASEKVRKLLIKETTGEKRFGNTIFEVYFEEKIYVIVFYCEYGSIKPNYLRKGPLESKIANVKQFCAKHPNAFVKNGFYYTNIKRKFQKPISLISDFFKNYKSIKGLTLNKISQGATSHVGQRALSLMISYVLPLYKVTIP
ncbi:MAG: hypothetical protein ACFFD2_14280, partial [Promethearchaeota archaeon]